MLERVIEQRLKLRLEGFGFDVLKLTCPGTSGVPDRMILMPTWSPGPPVYVELKAPKKHERALQEQRRIEWRERGCIVHDPCNSIEKVDALVASQLVSAVNRHNTLADLPRHIVEAYSEYVGAFK